MNNLIGSANSWTNKQKILIRFVIKSSTWGHHQHLDGWNQLALRFSHIVCKKNW